MKLYILKTSERWSYCRGGRVVVAENWDEVKEMFKYDELIESEEQETRNNWDVWIKVDELDTKKIKQEIILDEYNWA